MGCRGSLDFAAIWQRKWSGYSSVEQTRRPEGLGRVVCQSPASVDSGRRLVRTRARSHAIAPSAALLSKSRHIYGWTARGRSRCRQSNYGVRSTEYSVRIRSNYRRTGRRWLGWPGWEHGSEQALQLFKLVTHVPAVPPERPDPVGAATAKLGRERIGVGAVRSALAAALRAVLPAPIDGGVPPAPLFLRPQRLHQAGVQGFWSGVCGQGG